MAYKEQTGSQIWIPTLEGEVLEGEIIAKHEGGEYGIQYSIKSTDGETYRTPSHAVLIARLEKSKIGQKVKIQFIESVPPTVRGYHPTRIYKVWLDE